MLIQNWKKRDMKRQDLKEKFFELIRGDLSPEEEEKVIKDLEKSGISRDEIKSLRSVDQLIEGMATPEPSDRMDKRFYTMLEDEKKKSLLGEPDVKVKRHFMVNLVRPGLRIAAGIALFLLGWFASGWSGSAPGGNKQMANLTDEVIQLKETLILTMIQQNSSVERIKAVNMVSEFDNADSQIIESLIGVLNHDSNDNVRLLALEALVKYSSVPEVREGLVKSISMQTSPMVQLRLAEVMIALSEKRALPEFEKMLQDASLNYSVRGKMNEAVAVLL
jgi:hypothetical protein